MGLLDIFASLGKSAPMQGPMQPGHTWQSQPQSGLLGRLGGGIQGMQGNQQQQPQQPQMGDMPAFGQGAGGDGGLAQLIAQYMQQSRRS